MNLESERLDKAQLEQLSTAVLLKQALSEARLLVRAEVLHAKREMKEEVKAARTCGILLGSAGVLALSCLSVLFVALGMSFAMTTGVWVVGALLLIATATLGYLGVKKLPRQALPHTQERLLSDFHQTRGILQ